MATFPLLSSGAVTQYPGIFTVGQGVQSIQFIDGSSQRFLTQGRQFRRWHINLEALSDAEMESIQDFFAAMSGDYSTFLFPDPLTGVLVLNCRLGEPDLSLTFSGPNAGAASLWVIETNG